MNLEMKKIVFFFCFNLVLVVYLICELFVGFVDKRSEIVAQVSTWCVHCEAQLQEEDS